jgi:hypothetical protein
MRTLANSGLPLKPFSPRPCDRWSLRRPNPLFRPFRIWPSIGWFSIGRFCFRSSTAYGRKHRQSYCKCSNACPCPVWRRHTSRDCALPLGDAAKTPGNWHVRTRHLARGQYNAVKPVVQPHNFGKVPALEVFDESACQSRQSGARIVVSCSVSPERKKRSLPPPSACNDDRVSIRIRRFQGHRVSSFRLRASDSRYSRPHPRRTTRTHLRWTTAVDAQFARRDRDWR